MSSVITPVPSNVAPSQLSQTSRVPQLTRNGKFHIPRYVTACLLTSIGGFLNGYDTGCIGAVTEMKQFTETFGEMSPFLRGFSVSLLMLLGTFPAFFAGQMSDKWGRLHVVSLGAGVFTIGAGLQAASGHKMLPLFLVGRALCGLGEGTYLGNVIVYDSSH